MLIIKRRALVRLDDSPRRTYDVGLKYNNPKYFSGYIKGHYIRWVHNPYYEQSHSFIWD